VERERKLGRERKKEKQEKRDIQIEKKGGKRDIETNSEIILQKIHNNIVKTLLPNCPKSSAILG